MNIIWRRVSIILATGSLLSAGCATTTESEAPLPTMQTGPNAEITFDGLHRLDDTIAQFVWARPGLDLREFDQALISPVAISYKNEPQRRTRRGGSNFALTPRQKAGVKQLFQDVVVEELTRDNGFTIADEPGPTVLQINAELLDVVVSAPPEPFAGRSRIYVRSFGGATLVGELRDSETNEILVRVVDRKTVDSRGWPKDVSTDFGNRSELRSMFRFWASNLRKRLDQVRAMETIPASP